MAFKGALLLPARGAARGFLVLGAVASAESGETL